MLSPVNLSELGEELRDCRTVAELTREKLAKQIGISRGRVARVERGQSEIGLKEFDSWVRACKYMPIIDISM